ncbi:unnamed protein product [Caenorhabditis bovis]|uniref:Ig-like domain-containing protein n=1 Tax=Caenorhabditis bovis TaxID=2654633 RepID=A0A8S1E678_9PELO|nr:unnamed protein product [Caenorhabditis bovis]
MNFLKLLLAFAVIAGLLACPEKCTCHFNNIYCNELSTSQSETLLQALNKELKDIENLEIENTVNFPMNKLPSLLELKSLILNNCSYENGEHHIAHGSYPKATILKITNSNMMFLNTYISNAFPSLEVLDLSNNEILTITGDTAFCMPNLKIFDLSGNRFEFIPFDTFRMMDQLEVIRMRNNNLTKLETSIFYINPSLHTVDLSGNRIRRISSDSTNIMPTQRLDLSNNQLTSIPGLPLKNMEELIFLNLSSNPIKIIEEAAIYASYLEVLDVSHCDIAIIEAGAFSHVPMLHTLIVSGNKNLVSISSHSLANSTAVFTLDVRSTGLRYFPFGIMESLRTIYISDVRLDCACIAEQLNEITTVTIMDWAEATCVTKNGALVHLSQLSTNMLPITDKCEEEFAVPFTEYQEAELGTSYRIHCMMHYNAKNVDWILPNKSVVHATKPEPTDTYTTTDFFMHSLMGPFLKRPIINRTHATTEHFAIDVVLESDSGVYECISKDGKGSRRKINFKATKPNITLMFPIVRENSISVNWNYNLKIKAVDRVAFLIVYDGKNIHNKQRINLSLFQNYRFHNLQNLISNHSYNVCLEWIMPENNEMIYNTCLEVHTDPRLPSIFARYPKTFLSLLGILLGFIVYCIGKNLYIQYHLTEKVKNNAKMQQSVSGQSMLSNTTDGVTYENVQLQMSPSFWDPAV